ncbi:hypothetical protein HY628_00835 [Candidatus Uhrbacteria bacterium]|nr:hypothetical protein [Candidatus Uhrbacteria bacterium]
MPREIHPWFENREPSLARRRELAGPAKKSWLAGRKKWLALLFSGLAFGVWEGQSPPRQTLGQGRFEKSEPKSERGQRAKNFKEQLRALQKLDQTIQWVSAERAETPTPVEVQPDPYDPFLKLVYEDEDFADITFEKNLEGGYMVSPRDEVLSFAGIEVKREEDGTFTLGTASGLDWPVNVEAKDLKDMLQKKLDLSRLYRERLARETDEEAKMVGRTIVRKAQEAQIPVNQKLAKDVLGEV